MLDACIKKVNQAFEEAKVTKDQVSKVILVGGTTKIPEFRLAIECLFVSKNT